LEEQLRELLGLVGPVFASGLLPLNRIYCFFTLRVGPFRWRLQKSPGDVLLTRLNIVELSLSLLETSIPQTDDIWQERGVLIRII